MKDAASAEGVPIHVARRALSTLFRPQMMRWRGEEFPHLWDHVVVETKAGDLEWLGRPTLIDWCRLSRMAETGLLERLARR